MRFLFIAVFHLLIQIKQIIAIGTTEDREFLVSTPSTSRLHDASKVYPRISLSMMSVESNTVTITTEHIVSLDVLVNVTLNLEPEKAKVYYKNFAFYGMDVASGVRWTYHLIGKRAFSLLVMMMDDALMLETFTAIPVTGWGKRYTVGTLWSQVSIVIINYVDVNTVIVNVKATDPYFLLKINKDLFNSGQKAFVTLLAYQSYGISTCERRDMGGSISGTFFEGTKLFGMVSGHCKASTFTRSCDNKDTKTYKGIGGKLVAEMLPPVETFGRFFVLFQMFEMTLSGVYVVVGTQDNSYYVVSRGKSTMDFKLSRAGDSYAFEAFDGVLECGSPCLVVYYQNSSCVLKGRPGFNGDPSMMVITPIELYYFIYNVIVPPYDMKHVLLLVTSQDKGRVATSIDYLFTVGDDPVKEVLTKKIRFINTQTYWGQFEVWPMIAKKGTSFVLFSKIARFGIILYGTNNYSTYMHTIGMVSSNINAKYCLRVLTPPMFADDLVDNDCDGKVDEEELDNTDNDKDSRKDEDLHYLHNKKNLTDKEFVKLYQKTHPSDYFLKPVNFTKDTEPIQDVPTSKPREEPVETKPTMQRTTVPMMVTTISPPVVSETRRPAIDRTDVVDRSDKTARTDRTDNNKPTKVPDIGEFQPWTNWHCSLDCKNPLLVRERLCKKAGSPNCGRPQQETKLGNCFVGKKCPRDCKDYQWGIDCKMTCINCELPCDKFLGNCSSCKPGFQGPENSCLLSCGPNRYGTKCNGHCLEKCGEDCLERINGDCQVKNTAIYIPAIILLLIIPIGIMIFFLTQRKKLRKGSTISDDIQTKSTASKSQASEKSAKDSKVSQFSSSADSEHDS